MTRGRQGVVQGRALTKGRGRSGSTEALVKEDYEDYGVLVKAGTEAPLLECGGLLR